MFGIRKRAYQLIVASVFLAGFIGINTAQAADKVPGVTDNEIRVGNLDPHTGPAAVYDGIRKGVLSYFNYVNDQGGVKGRKLKLIAYDDQYQPAKTVRLMKRLVEEDNVFATVGDVGTPTNTAIKNFVVKKGLPMIMLCSAATRFFQPPIANFMGACIASYAFEGDLMLNYAVKKLGAKRIAIAYSNDDYGTPINESATKAMKNYPDAKIVARVNYQVGDSDFSAQAQKLRQAKPDAILVFSQPSPTAHLKKALYDIGVTSKNTDYLTTQEGGNDTVVWDLAGKDAWQGSYSMAMMPGAYVDTKPMKLFVREFKKNFPDTSPSGSPQVGWAAAQVFVEALKRTKDLTRENFLKSFYTFNNWQGSLYAGVTFTPKNHYGVTSLIITRAKDGKMLPVSGGISKDPDTGKFVEHGSAN